MSVFVKIKEMLIFKKNIYRNINKYLAGNKLLIDQANNSLHSVDLFNKFILLTALLWYVYYTLHQLFNIDFI